MNNLYESQKILLDNCKNIQINRKSYIYKNSKGVEVPRVTEILSTMIHSDAIVQWANSLGFRHMSYKETLEKAANIGTITHEAIENFYKNGEKSDAVSFLAFLSWYESVSENHTITSILLEEPLTCEYYGGTCDAVIDIDGRKYLVDYKTSNHITFKYALQLGAYIYMLYIEKGIILDGTIILQLNKHEPVFNEYMLDFSYMPHKEYMDFCIETFHYLVNGFYRIKYCEQQFKHFFTGRTTI